MKKTLTYFVLGLLVTSSITACSLIPRSAEPELGAALASTSADQDHGTSLAADGVQFNTDEATLQPGANKMVSEAVDYLRSNPGSQVIIEGHTDRTGSKSYNQKLSEKRADILPRRLLALPTILIPIVTNCCLQKPRLAGVKRTTWKSDVIKTCFTISSPQHFVAKAHTQITCH